MPTRSAASRRQERRLQHQDLSRGQLLDAAEEVFGRKGFHDTTLKEIAELAEFSVGSVYSFFDSKDHLFRAIFVRRGDEFMVGIRELLAGVSSPDANPLALLHALVEFEVVWFRTHARFGRLYLRYSSAAMLSTDREADSVIAGNYEESMRLQAQLFERGQADGVFRPGEPSVLARMFSGIVSSYQALDPAVVDDDPDHERLPLADLHDLVEAAFADPAPKRRKR